MVSRSFFIHKSMIAKKKGIYNKKLNKNILEKLVKKAKLLSVYHNIVENDEREAYTRNWHIAFAQDMIGGGS